MRTETRRQGTSASKDTDRPAGLAGKAWWQWLKRLAKIAFFAAVAYLLFTQARSIEWDKVFSALQQRPLEGLLIAGALAALSHLLYSCFDLFGRQATGHGLPVPKVMTVNFISYAFNLNFGSLIGGVAFRYRLYSRLGLDTEVITRVLLMSMITNWLGYLLLAGLSFWLNPIDIPKDWKIDQSALRILGFVLFLAAMAYVALCAFSRRRSWSVRGKEITLPPLRVALLQLGVSSVNWMLISGAIYFLLEQKLAYPAVLAVLLVAAVAGVITHVPAGLGVLEAVFIALLAGDMSRNDMLAGLLAYRAIYYLLPLVIALLLYLLTEARAKQTAGEGAS
ncbi:lysylphosphatidylglycerol synthase domain-containing protein [Noviherbaspirillum sp. CPCC 100848]|uniref:Lysylphosphatidylglycerol synthase domain-containing protein n=1 Tax=Noviherbaspirillum album TaxID=3080276 RepID=A0ABU6JF62_9BURK|nr:lysylphosphatidylglycerol synthase domain-containing protein [Noviherbaspirillum sp. CPCC 100848]MEC4722311.1 lysylphosphatidylglycerol synthase domain-containing protein [Noviherbaspirillum sp. CPCC 100848]